MARLDQPFAIARRTLHSPALKRRAAQHRALAEPPGSARRVTHVTTHVRVPLRSRSVGSKSQASGRRTVGKGGPGSWALQGGAGRWTGRRAAAAGGGGDDLYAAPHAGIKLATARPSKLMERHSLAPAITQSPRAITTLEASRALAQMSANHAPSAGWCGESRNGCRRRYSACIVVDERARMYPVRVSAIEIGVLSGAPSGHRHQPLASACGEIR